MLSETKVNLTKSDYENIPPGSSRLLCSKLLLLLRVAVGDRLWEQYFGRRRIRSARRARRSAEHCCRRGKFGIKQRVNCALPSPSKCTQLNENLRSPQKSKAITDTKKRTMVHSGAYLSHYLLRPPPSSSAISQLYSTAIVASSCRRRKTTVFRETSGKSAPLLKTRNLSIQIVAAADELRSLYGLKLQELAKVVLLSRFERDSVPRAKLLLLDQSRLD